MTESKLSVAELRRRLPVGAKLKIVRICGPHGNFDGEMMATVARSQTREVALTVEGKEGLRWLYYPSKSGPGGNITVAATEKGFVYRGVSEHVFEWVKG